MRRFVSSLLLATGCAAAPSPSLSVEGVLPAPSALVSVAIEDAGAPPSGSSLGEPSEVDLPSTIREVPGERSVLFVLDEPEAPVAFARRADATTMGPLLAFPKQHVLGAFDAEAGDTFTVVTTEGPRVCVQTFAREAKEPTSRGCRAFAPALIVPLGDRLAALELAIERPPAPRVRAPEPTRKKSREKGSKKSDKPKSSAPARSGPSPKSSVDVKLRWITRAGVFDDDTVPTGIHFQAPLEGMTLVDARAHGAGADVLWYENAPKRKSATSLGSARLMSGFVRADGKLDLASRVAVLDADLDFGLLKDHRWPRLYSDSAGTVFVDVDRDNKCEAARVQPGFRRLDAPAAVCSIAPSRLGSATPIEAAEEGAYAAILARSPRRTRGQVAHDPGLVAWAQDRAYFFSGGALRSASRADGALRDVDGPFHAKRSRAIWSGLTTDGGGVALVDGAVARIALGAVVARVRLPEDPARGALLSAEPDRARSAKIGDSFWSARGDLVRVAPDFLAPAALRGLAHVDATALVGGADKGLLLTVSGGSLSVRTLDASGALGASVRTRSLVLPGFAACERAKGGALVAGVSAADRRSVIAFAVDATGAVSSPMITGLTVREGELGVRLTALPGGGALVTDRARAEVAWLDEDGASRAKAAWPAEDNGAPCVDGVPARSLFPSPVPGKLVRVEALAAPGVCVVGDPVWSTDGSLRWVESRVHDLDLATSLGVFRAEPAVALGSGGAILAVGEAASAPSCPPDMVSIAGKFCIDRFEDALVDAASGEPLSPDYAATPAHLEVALGEWSTGRERTHDVYARAFPLPFPGLELGRKVAPLALSRYGARPAGFVSGVVAEAACIAAGKRLCSLDEHTTACRGEGDTDFPYGDDYQAGVCNVFREQHPAATLHGNVSVGHLDPRLNHVPDAKGAPLFQRTGQSLACRSKWGTDAAYDLAGNVDEWVDRGPKLGVGFAGGFYSRATRSGCDALVTNHPKPYFDYSTGVRCCSDPAR